MSTNEAGTQVPTTPAADTVRHQDNLPKGQLELATLGLATSKAWNESALGSLLYKTKAQYAAQVAAYKESLGLADGADDEISPNAREFRRLDKKINNSLKYVKAYLAEDHDDDKGKGFFEEFGIERKGKNWMLPTAQPARAEKLQKLLAALVKHSYGSRKYGTAFWTPLATRYAELVSFSGTTRGDASAAVGAKNAQEEPLREMLRALIHLIKANYPNELECKGILRQFGFQKEVY